MEKKEITSGNTIVDRMLNYNLTDAGAGVYIPLSWYNAIHFENGKTYHIACSILAEIVYWYSPKKELDKKNGQIINIKKRFRADLLQKSYADLAKTHGITKDQATKAIIFLEKLDVINRVFRTITVSGMKIPNVLYIQLNVDRLFDITYPAGFTQHIDGKEDDSIGGIQIEKGTSSSVICNVSNLDTDCVSSKKQTNTDITTEITTSTSGMAKEDDEATYSDLIASNIKLDAIKKESPKSLATINMIYRIICNVFKSKKKNYKINDCQVTAAEIKDTFLHKIGKCEIQYAIRVIESHIRNDSNPISESYVRTVLFNAPLIAKAWIEQTEKNIAKSKSHNTHDHINYFLNFTQRNDDLDAYLKKKFPSKSIINDSNTSSICPV